MREAVVVRFGAALFAAVLPLGVLAGCTSPRDATVAPARASAPSPEPGPAACPAVLDDADTSFFSTRGGELVPRGATAAALCVYPFVDGPQKLGRTVPLVGDPQRLLHHLNGLGPVENPEDRMCTLVGRDQYQVVLGYGADRHALVRIDHNCGLVSSAGAVRQPDGWSTLIGFWPAVDTGAD